MKKLLLRNFEHQLQSKVWNDAQDLMYAGAVRRLRETDKHLWLGTVIQDDTGHEVELLLTPTQIKAFSCDCWVAKRSSMCVHLAAFAGQVRQYLEQKATQQQEAEKAKIAEKIPKLSINTLLNRVDMQELIEFVKDYARQDKDFNIALKSRFAASVSDDDAITYPMLMRSVLPTLHQRNTVINKAVFSRLQRLLSDFIMQLQNAIVASNYLRAFHIATTILQEISPVVQMTTQQQADVLTDVCNETIEKLVELCKQPISRELLEKVRTYLLEGIKVNYFPISVRNMAIVFTADACKEQEYYDQVSSLFYNTTRDNLGYNIIITYLTAIGRKGLYPTQGRIVEEYLSDIPRKMRLFQDLFTMGEYESVMHLIEPNLENSALTQRDLHEMEQLYLQSAHNKKDLPRLKDYFTKKFLKTGHIEHFDALKKIVPEEKWAKAFESLFKKVRDKGETRILAIMLCKEQHYDTLATFLEEEGSFELLRQVKRFLLPQARQFIQTHYDKYLSGYLDDHFGRPATLYVHDNLRELILLSEIDLAYDIANNILRKHKDRAGLKEEIMVLFPKNKRPSLVKI